MTAGQICTHRTDVSVLWSEEPVETWEETIHRTRHSLFPICGENVDNIIGILNAKDYFRLDDKSRENIMENAVREPYFVHENMKADSLFAQMKKTGGYHFAVVVDEYGGMTGIITNILYNTIFRFVNSAFFSTCIRHHDNFFRCNCFFIVFRADSHNSQYQVR